MKRRLRLGMLGTGLAANLLYLPALKKTSHRIEVVACASRRKHKAQQFARQVGCSLVVDSAEQLFALEQVQAVLISLPIQLQPPYVIAALRAGKAVLSEKPVAPSVSAAKRLIKATARYPGPWMIGENYHFMAHVRRLLQWIAAEHLGDLRIIEASQINRMDRTNPYYSTTWRREPTFDGGFIVDSGVHLAHVVRLVAGMPQDVVSHTAQFDPALPPMDTAVALMRFSGGVLGTWTSCFAGHSRGPMLRVSGSRGCAELGWNAATLYDAKGKRTVFESPIDSFQTQFEHFADVVAQGTVPAVTPHDALQDLALMEAIIGV